MLMSADVSYLSAQQRCCPRQSLESVELQDYALAKSPASAYKCDTSQLSTSCCRSAQCGRLTCEEPSAIPFRQGLPGSSYRAIVCHVSHVPARNAYCRTLNDNSHTSGSTGLPKPLIYTHDTLARNTRMMSLEPPPGSESQHRVYQGARVFSAFPPFHVSHDP